MINILLVDDHQVVRQGIQSLLELDSSLKVVGETGNQDELFTLLAEKNNVQVVVMDISMPDVDGIALTRTLKDRYPQLLIVVLSMMDQLTYVIQSFDAGASAFLIKNISKEELLFAVKHVAQGQQYICAEISNRLCMQFIKTVQKPLPDKALAFQINNKEMEVLALTANGYTNQEIAEQLFTSKRTIEGYRQSLMEKTGVRNSSALIKFAFQNGLLA